jgi:hypothetical protein
MSSSWSQYLALPLENIDESMIERLSALLLRTFRRRNSSQFGGAYYYAGWPDPSPERYYLFRNTDAFDDTAQYAEYPKEIWVMRIDGTARPLPELQRLIEQALGVQVQPFVPRQS